MSRVGELLRKGLLKRIPPSAERAEKSLRMSERYLKDARKCFDSGIYEMCILAAWNIEE